MNSVFKKLKNFSYKKVDLNQSGYFLITAIVMILFITALALTIVNLTTVQYQTTAHESYTQNAELTAEAGIEQSVNALNANNSFTGYPTTQTFFNNNTQGMATFTTSITTNADNSKTILSIANVYTSSTATTPTSTRKVQAIAVGTGSSGYSVYTGPGGLILSGSANVDNSDVYVGGTITLTGAAKIGTYSTPVNVDVANDACPTGSNPGPTYPQVCSDGSQPISLDHSTDIYGSVCATGQTSTGPNNNIQKGNGGQGLEAGCTAPVASPPTYNRAAQISAVTTTASSSNSAYTCSGSQSTSWPANLELTGNVNIGGSCTLTINGNVYITGTLTIGGAATIKVANSVGTTRPVIITDGIISVGGSASMIANSSGTGIQYISFTNNTGNPAATPTGTSLYTSQQTQTVSVSGGVNLPGMIFDSYWGEVTISGSGSLGAAEGQTVNLSGAGTVIFGTQLASGSQTWKITSYKPVY